MATLIKQIKKVKTLEELEALDIGRVVYDISYRGGYIGFNSIDIAEKFDINQNHLAINFGAHCNYLGGGVRGTIIPSNYSSDIVGAKSELLDALGQACVRVYEYMEDEMNLNDTDGDEPWDALATEAAREAEIVSGY